MSTPNNIVYLMRGLPATGKSYTAKKLAGTQGIICETDKYFYTKVGQDKTKFDYSESLLPMAQAWNFERFQQAVMTGRTPIVVDRGNGLTLETKRYAQYAIEQGYTVEIAEPESAWWQEIRVLLKYKSLTGPVLDQWAQELARYSSAIHRVPAKTIRRRMDTWVHGLTVNDILNYCPKT